MLRFLHRKHATHNHRQNKYAGQFALFAFTTALGSAGFWTIFPIILNDIVGSEALVGVYYSAISVLLFFVSLGSTVLFMRMSKVKLMKWMLLITISALLIMSIANRLWHLAIFDVLRGVAVTLVGIGLSLLIRDFSRDKELGAVEGKVYLYANAGRLIGPALAGFLTNVLGNEAVFIFASICYSITFVLFLRKGMFAEKNSLAHTKHDEPLHELFTNIKSYFKDIKRVKVFAMALGLNLWRAISAVYIPLHLDQFGYSQEFIGIAISLSMLPLVLLEGRVGKTADRVGVRRFFLAGFGILAGGCVAIMGLAAWPIVLIVTFILLHIGSAFVEPLQETYLFKVIKKEESPKYFGIYNTADPVANTIGPLFAAGVLFLSHNNISVLWVALGLAFLVFVGIGISIKE